MQHLFLAGLISYPFTRRASCRERKKGKGWRKASIDIFRSGLSGTPWPEKPYILSIVSLLNVMKLVHRCAEEFSRVYLSAFVLRNHWGPQKVVETYTKEFNYGYGYALRRWTWKLFTFWQEHGVAIDQQFCAVSGHQNRPPSSYSGLAILRLVSKCL